MTASVTPNQMLTRPKPITMTAADLALEHNSPREAPPGVGIAASAWVRFSGVPVLGTAVAVQWSDPAFLIRWKAGDGGTLEAWVWKGTAARR